MICLYTRLTIPILDQYIRKQDGVHLSGIQVFGLCHLNTGPVGIKPLFDHSNTELVWYSDPNCNVLPLRDCHEYVPLLFNVSMMGPYTFLDNVDIEGKLVKIVPVLLLLCEEDGTPKVS